MVDRVKAEPRVLPIRAKLSERFCRGCSSEVEYWNFMKFGEFGLLESWCLTNVVGHLVGNYKQYDMYNIYSDIL